MKKTISIFLILMLLLTACGGPEKETESAAAEVKWDMIPCVMINNTPYVTTGVASSRTDHPETPHGTITSEVPGSELPTENDQSNFGTGYEYFLGYIKGTVEVKHEGQWWIYAEDQVKASGLYRQPYLKFGSQNEALAAHENMFSHFGWDGDQSTLKTSMPKNYGGCYINDDNVFCVCLVSPTETDIQEFYTACGTENIYIQPVKYTLSELFAAAEAIGAYNESHDTPLCWGWGPNEADNGVFITVAEDMAQEAEALRTQHPCIQYSLDTPALSPAEHPTEKSREDITLTAEYPVYPTDVETIAFFFENGSEEYISYPDEYLEIEIDGVWHAIPYCSDVAFTLTLPGLAPGQTTAVYQRTDIRNFDFNPGKYRFGIGYCYEEDYNGENADYIAWAEFELKDDAVLPEFGPMEEQRFDVNTAVTEGCAVLVSDSMVNSQVIDTFCKKSLAQMKSELRIVDHDNEIVYHIAYTPDYYQVDILEAGTTRTRYYAALGLWEDENGSQIVLSTYRNLQDVQEEDHPIFAEFDLLPLITEAQSQDIDAYTATKAEIRKDTENRLEGNITYQQVRTAAGSTEYILTRSDFEEVRTYDLGISGTMGGMLYCFNYPVTEAHPIYVFPAKDNLMGVIFRNPDGSEELRLFDPSEETFTATIPLSGSAEETINEYRETKK